MKIYPYNCVICNRSYEAFFPRKSEYVCSKCKQLRDKKNKKARAGTSALKNRLIKKRGHTCEICKSSYNDLIAHHKTPVSQGGKTTESNVLLICQTCHNNIHSEMPINWQGYRILLDGDNE